MTVKFEQIKFADESEVTFFEPSASDMDLLKSDTPDMTRRVLVSAVRDIMRDERCTQIPYVMGLFKKSEPDEWGNDLLVEVEYSKRGWRAVFAAKYVEKGPIVWTCYMD